MLQFGVLGPIEVVATGGPLQLGGPRQRSTLALLLLNMNRVVSIDELADALYAGRPPVTAVTQVHKQIAELRRVLGSEAIRTQGSGYVINIARKQIDLARFEELLADAAEAISRSDPASAAAFLKDALALWRGEALGDLRDEEFFVPQARRLEELRLTAHERLAEAELALGRHAEVAAELERLVALHPLRESLRALQMLALYRSGRQAEALEVFRRARAELVERFGIEPGSALRAAERAILQQDPALELDRPAVDEARVVLILASRDAAPDELMAVARPLAGSRELILARFIADEDQLATAAEALNSPARSLGSNVRTAVFTSTDAVADAVRLADSYAVELVLADSVEEIDGEHVPDELAALFNRSPADVAVVSGPTRISHGIFVPFGGGEHDWAALELATWLAAAAGTELVLVGTGSNRQSGRRDASRLLAHAALAAQRLAGVSTRPLLAAPSHEDLCNAVKPAGAVIIGLTESWQSSGIGDARRALVAAGAPLVLVHRGPRPGGLAPNASRTRFSWTLDYPQAVCDEFDVTKLA
ncbi:MAG TPA: AfsR/SARP family transcriptional regulator [Gaiellaceae bacterium]|nr:AfsR/SARP family transcriptional regulator [Gaiellaceae bacterium]